MLTLGTDYSNVVQLNREMEYTSHKIMPITGHESLKEVERYTKAAEQKRLAKSPVVKFQGQN